MLGRIPRRLLAAALVLSVAALGARGCGEPAFEFHVTFPDAQGLEPGSPVSYAGVPVGEVAALAIDQPDRRAAGRVRVRVAIREPGLRVRQGDRFRVVRGGWLSRTRLEIEPGEDEAPPLESGATIAGDPEPILDVWAARFQESLRALVGPAPDEAAGEEP